MLAPGGVTVAAMLTALPGVVPAHAAISGTAAPVVQVVPPASVRLGDFESDTEVRGFDEQPGVVLQNAVTVDISTAGTFDDMGDLTPAQARARVCHGAPFPHRYPGARTPR